MTAALLIGLGVWMIAAGFVVPSGPCALLGILAIGVGAWSLMEPQR